MTITRGNRWWLIDDRWWLINDGSWMCIIFMDWIKDDFMKSKKKALPVCPDPALYIAVHTKEGSFWRRKRGSVKPIVLNNAFKATANNAAISGPIAKSICRKLQPFTEGLDTGRQTIAIINMLNKSLAKNSAVDYSFFINFDFQKRFPLVRLLEAGYRFDIKKDMLCVEIDLTFEPMKRHNKLATHYYFELILLYGNPAKENTLRVETEQSLLYSFTETYDTNCSMSLQMPKQQPWMLILKASCMEDDLPAHHYKYYGMKVVGVSEG